ncbi:MAG: glycosyltransferase family 39 protein, partial [Deltaproteobacteria bacterium]|nr:glycosyltransferase family 39 protein [Deltaproteobacteria bacterium]
MRAYQEEKGRVFWVILFLLGVLACLIISVIILSLVPPISKDALVHHLAVAKLYIRHGGMYEIPFMPFSYYPMNLNLMYMIPHYFGNDIAPKFIHFTFALLTAGLIFYYLKNRTNILYGLLGAILFLSVPIIVKLSITVYVDLGEIFFSFAALVFLLEWVRSGFQIRFLIFSGILCGLALGTKYNGLITLFLLTLFIPFLYSRHHKDIGAGFFKPVGFGVLFLLISLLIFSPWMIRNYHWKNNPIYPLHNKLFNPPKTISKSIPSHDNIQKQNQGFFTYRSMIYHESGWQIVLLPLRIFFQGRDGDPQYFDGKLNPFLLLLPFFAFVGPRGEPEYLRCEKKIVLVFAVLFLCFGLFSAVMRIRYISPIIPPLVILSVFGVEKLIGVFRQSRSKAVRWAGLTLVTLILIFTLSLNTNYIIGQFKYVAPFRYLDGSVNRDKYIAGYRPEYPAQKYINDNLDSDAKLLFIFLGKRGYYCDREYVFDIGILERLIKSSESPEDILNGLDKQGITHILIYYHLFEKWMSDNFSEEKLFLTQRFFREHVELLFHENGFGVLNLRD